MNGGGGIHEAKIKCFVVVFVV